MDLPTPMVSGTLIKRYKRFLADVELDSGEVVTAHCANSGSMMGLKDAGVKVWLSANTNPKAKLDWRWELVALPDTLVGINTSRPNGIVEEAILEGKIAELSGYETLKREVKYGKNSRIDILLSDPKSQDSDKDLCYVEVKNVTLSGDKQGTRAALFPDAVTARGTKHLLELLDMVRDGHRAVMVYLVQRTDTEYFSIADDIDPEYGKTLRYVLDKGVEALCYQCNMSTTSLTVGQALPIKL